MSKKDNTTALFIEKVRALVDSNSVKSKREIVDKLGWDETAMSNVLRGRRNVPADVAERFFKLYNIEKLDKQEGTPVYDLHATASHLDNMTQLPEVPSFHVNVPGYEDCNFGLYVYGHSMYPTIENGSLILCKRIQDKTLILYGEIYLIKTRDYLVVKRLQKAPVKKAIQCVSDNREKNNGDSYKFETFDLEVDKIIDLYLVKGIIKKTQS